jgi:hypothetical protein
MRNNLCMLFLLTLLPTQALGQIEPAQRPLAAPGALPAAIQEHLTALDPDQAELRWVNGRWQLFTDGALLKDFGLRRAEAWEALGLIRSLHLTEHGTVGSPETIIEYWLTGGKAPQAPGIGLRLFPIDLASLSIQNIQGQFCLRDAQRILFSFGRQHAAAQQALAILRNYGFTQVGYVGWPTPVMMYFVGDDGGRVVPASAQAAPAAAAAHAAGNSGQLGKAPLLGVRQLAQPLPDSLGDHFRFDPSRVELKQDRTWKLIYGQRTLAEFGSCWEARQALSLIQSYRFTEQCWIGGVQPSFSYFLVHGQGPQGLRFGVPSQAFTPQALVVTQAGADWMVSNGQQPLMSFGDRRDDAQQFVEVVQHYHFDRLCRIGPVGPLSMTFLVRTR